MPTGYTADIEKDITFQQFAMNCARAFGPLVSMRDESNDVPIPEEFIGSPYHANELRIAQEKLKTLENLSDEEIKEQAKKDFSEKMLHYEQELNRQTSLKTKYENMLTKVKQWEPQTHDHIELKNFMIQQINSSIDFDCYRDLKNDGPIMPCEYTSEEWLDREKDEAKWHINCHTEELVKEIERINFNNKWLKELRKSLGV